MSISRFIFLSAERETRSAESNAIMHTNLGNDLSRRSIVACEVEGYYEGAHEKSWMIDVDRSVENGNARVGVEAAAVRLGQRYGQDSVLVIDNLSQANLVYLSTGAHEYMGKFLHTEQPVDQLQGYSVLPDGSVWTCQQESGS